MLIASRYCDLCDGMPWWEEPLLVVTGLLIAITIVSGLARLSDRLSARRRAPKRGGDPPDV
ncbi:MAG TPA: hypothetical protein VN224_00675 [Xanthomonadales bacterium]|nr:hypothetical protein [Xanthomonadales bacterium]